MKPQSYGIFLLLLLSTLWTACKSTQAEVDISPGEQQAFKASEGEPVVISDPETEYEIIIVDPGFYSWLKGFARPEGYYSQAFLENRNEIYVLNWNNRVLLPGQYDPNLYMWPIDYDPKIDYGYEVNYKLYNYFIYFQRKYNQRLGPFIPRL
jgi:hypothetical protein